MNPHRDHPASSREMLDAALAPLFKLSMFWTPERQASSAWIEHVPFAFWLVDVLRPSTIVELGTHHGVSYSAMCQAVKSLGLPTRCFAVDTWKGDEHAGHYPEEIYRDFATFHDQRYGAFSHLVRSTFDEALPHFEDQSIDLLHIDGLHTYEAVRHDFESWLPKLSRNGIVMFHDTNVRERGFGVFQVWSEFSAGRLHFTFLHGHGLGILGLGREYLRPLRLLFGASKDGHLASSIRALFAHLGRSVALSSDLDDAHRAVTERARQVEALKQTITEQETKATALDQALSERTSELGAIRSELAARDAKIAALDQALSERTSELGAIRSELAGREAKIGALDQALSERTSELGALQQTLVESRVRISSVESILSSLQASTSSRMTAPLRWIKRSLGRLSFSSIGFPLTRGWRALRTRSRSPLRDWRAARVIARSGLFDREWYLKNNLDVAALRIDPIRHYVAFGTREGRDPSPSFSTRAYLSHNEDVAVAEVNPFSHFLLFGIIEGRTPATFPRKLKARSQNRSRRLPHPLRLLAHTFRGRKDLLMGPSSTSPLSSRQLFAKAIRYWRLNGTRSLLSRLSLELRKRQKTLVGDVALSTNILLPLKVGDLIQSRFPSISPLRIYETARGQRRVNIVTDSINSGSLYGGVGTAMILGTLFAEASGASLRVITRTEAPQTRNFREVIRQNNITFSKNVEFSFSNLSGASPIAIHENDRFVTTSWWTTEAVRRAVRSSQITYLLQEDERMFYPLGDDHFRCAELLSRSDIRFIINSRMLFDHLVDSGLSHLSETGMYFEPAFPNTLFYSKPRNDGRKRFMFYARPNNLRNLFYLGIEAIDSAIRKGIFPLQEWDFVFVGKDIPRLEFDGSVVPKIEENLAWGDYASLIRSTDLGLSLMYTPHPSYPPLDVAASGGIAVTNQFARKRSLAQYSNNIICAELSVSGLVDSLSEGVRRANNLDERQTGYNNGRLHRDWRKALSSTLVKLEGIW